MRTFTLDQIRQALDYPSLLDNMRAALIAHSQGECHTPMPMHLAVAPASAEVHIKASYRLGGPYFALKAASTFPRNRERGMSTGNGMMLLFSAETGEPLAFLADSGHLTDVRTAAVAAMTARELGRRDRAIGILGAGIQAHLSAVFHHQFLRPDLIVLWARSRDRAEALAHQIRALTPAPHVEIAPSAADLARTCRLILTCTAARHPLLRDPDIQPGTHISAIGSDSPGKQELDPVLLRRATLLLADSLPQCAALGELQHAPDLRDRAIEIGDFCLHPRPVPPEALTIADFTGIGVEDLYIAQSVYERLAPTA